MENCALKLVNEIRLTVYVQRNMVDRSRNQCCRGKAVLIFFKCVFEDFGIQHTMRMHHILIQGFAKVRKATISFVMSVRPHGKNMLSQDGLSLKLVIFLKICPGNSSFIKVCQE
jgi:hypothetical protein